MRGKRRAALKLLLLPACFLGAGIAAAEDAPPLPTPSPDISQTVFILDASKSMAEKIGDTDKLGMLRTVIGNAITQQGERLSFGLVAFGHRKESNCADTEIVAKPGELNGSNYEKLLGGIKAKGQAPIAAAMSDAASLRGDENKPLDIVLLADGGDTCDADLCVTADALKQKASGLRIHVIGLSEKAEELQPLACIAAATGGKFVATTHESELEQGLSLVLEKIGHSAVTEVVAVGKDAFPPQGGAQDGISPEAAAEAMASQTDVVKSGETAVLKSGAQSGGQQTLAQRAVPPQPKRPVPVTLKALVTEVGPKLEQGLTWRVYSARPSADGKFELVSTHREAAPTAALLPGEYLVNAAYGLSNLTKKIKVESGRSVEETFVLNTGGLALRAVLANGAPCPEDEIRFDILSDEEDQFGNRRTILADAKPETIIRLNAGAYHVVSLYGDANASVGVDVTVEPGRVTEATIKHNGAKITFRLVQSLGGEALANTKWRILTSAGDTVKANAGALPTHILAAGSYAVVADHDGQSYTRKFSIEPGADKQIEVAIEDGPTSPEALQALLDPPEGPPPGTGGLSGEGPGSAVGFDGFSARPADPNAPLINPGTLFRPSSP